MPGQQVSVSAGSLRSGYGPRSCLPVGGPVTSPLPRSHPESICCTWRRTARTAPTTRCSPGSSWWTARCSGHDIAAVDPVPAHVVLSACEFGRATVRAGEETLGMTAAWQHAGAPVRWLPRPCASMTRPPARCCPCTTPGWWPATGRRSHWPRPSAPCHRGRLRRRWCASARAGSAARLSSVRPPRSPAPVAPVVGHVNVADRSFARHARHVKGCSAT